MKCLHCGQEHPDNFTFCPVTGKKIQLDSPALLACTHEGCPIYGQHILPADSIYCPECGYPIEEASGGSASGSSAFGASGPGGSAIEEFTVGDVTFKMIRVEGGTFTMGATPEQGSDAYEDEKPAHKVTLTKAYYLGETPVTQGLWVEVMGDNPSYFGEDAGSYGDDWESLPVELVSWEDCQKFIHKLNHKTGKRFRLPTEAEWEFASRGGNKSAGYRYAGSDELEEVAWYDDNSDQETHPVKELSPNELGLYDMSGNVVEWCQDWYDDYSSSAQTNPKGPSSGTFRVYRDGCWCSSAWCCRSSYRNGLTPDDRCRGLGLRLCLSELRTEGDDEWMLS